MRDSGDAKDLIEDSLYENSSELPTKFASIDLLKLPVPKTAALISQRTQRNTDRNQTAASNNESR